MVLGDDFIKLEKDMYMSSDSQSIIIFSPEKWKTLVKKMSAKFDYDVIDYPTNNKYLEVYNEYAEYGFKFVGKMEIYEHCFYGYEYLKRKAKGKLFSRADVKLFWNSPYNDPFNEGENISSQIIIQE